MNTFKAFFLAVALIFLASCTNNSPADLQNNTIEDIVTYQNTVKAIVDTNCISCHGSVPTNGAPMSLTTYENVKTSVLSRGSINRITRMMGDGSLMPQGGPKLPQAKIDAIIKWQTQGFQQ